MESQIEYKRHAKMGESSQEGSAMDLVVAPRNISRHLFFFSCY